MHKNLILFALISGLLACEGKKDELTPYIQTLQGLDNYSQQLMRYQVYLTTEGMTSQAHDVEKVMQTLLDELEKVELEDKRLRALHNAKKRALKAAMRKLVEPDFPTFVPNAQKSIGRVEDEFTKIYSNLEIMWERAGKTEPFPLKWEAQH